MKPWYASKIIWTSLFTLLALASQQFGVDITPAEQGDLADKVVAFAEAATIAVGGVMTIVFRFGTNKSIG